MPNACHSALPHRSQGFTLSEVLIALALLGIIAAFAIPKVLQNTQNTQRKSIFKESISTLSEVTYKAHLSQKIRVLEDFNTFLAANLNAIQVCSNHDTENCYPNIGGSSTPAASYRLPSGAIIVDIEHLTDPCDSGLVGQRPPCYDQFDIDYNGPAPPNIRGEDRVAMAFNLSNRAYQGIQPGQVGPDPQSDMSGTDVAENRAFYLRMMGID